MDFPADFPHGNLDLTGVGTRKHADLAGQRRLGGQGTAQRRQNLRHDLEWYDWVPLISQDEIW